MNLERAVKEGEAGRERRLSSLGYMSMGMSRASSKAGSGYSIR
jgi:hypothetical protein